MPSFQMWKETPIKLGAGLNTLNLDPTANIVKVINENMNGSVLYMSTKSDVTPSKFEEKVEKGSSTSLVRTRPLHTAYVFNPSGNPVTVTLIQIETDDISFIFNATNQVQISGVLTGDGLKKEELNLDGSRNLGVKVMNPTDITSTNIYIASMQGTMQSVNDKMITQNMLIDGIATNTYQTTQKLQDMMEGFEAKKVTVSGDTTIKTGGGLVAGIRTLGAITMILKDGTTEKWKHTAPAYDTFSKPISISGNIVVNLSGAGEAYIIYK